MKRDLKHITLFTQDGCLTQEALQLYLYGQPDRKTSDSIKKHLSDCSLCKEASVGLKDLEKNKYFRSVQNINTHISRKYSSRKYVRNGGSDAIRKLSFYAAASVVLIAGFVYYLNLNQEDENWDHQRLLGESSSVSDSVNYFNIMGLSRKYVEIDPDENLIESSEKNIIREPESEERFASREIVTETKQNYIVKNDMIISESNVPKLLEPINYPFKVLLKKKIDSLLMTTPVDLKYDIIAEFIISRDGVITDPKILSSDNSVVDSFTVKALEDFPKWKPATINNTPVDYPVRINITNY